MIDFPLHFVSPNGKVNKDAELRNYPNDCMRYLQISNVHLLFWAVFVFSPFLQMILLLGKKTILQTTMGLMDQIQQKTVQIDLFF